MNKILALQAMGPTGTPAVNGLSSLLSISCCNDN